MVGAELGIRLHQARDGGGDVAGPGGLPALVVDDRDGVVHLGEARHRLDEVRAVFAVEPCCPYKVGAGTVRPHRPLPGCLGSPVCGPRRDRGVFGVRSGREPVEDIVGRQVDQPSAVPGAGSRRGWPGLRRWPGRPPASRVSASSTWVHAAVFTTTSKPATTESQASGLMMSRSALDVATTSAPASDMTSTTSRPSMPWPPGTSTFMRTRLSDLRGRFRPRRGTRHATLGSST